jgi:hypothetical protein
MLRENKRVYPWRKEQLLAYSINKDGYELRTTREMEYLSHLAPGKNKNANTN